MGQVDALEVSTRRLSREIAGLRRSLDRVNALESEQIEVREASVLALTSALEALDMVSANQPILDDVARDAVRHTDLRQRFLRLCSAFAACIMLGSYVGVTGYGAFSSSCLRRSYLSSMRASICDHVFVGDRPIHSGLQYSTTLPKR